MNKELTEAKERIKTILRFRNQVEGDIPFEDFWADQIINLKGQGWHIEVVVDGK